ncbi:hypothetical protein L6452_38790 [Arctium lappa]|uniref:Uncharacterized protein n=1 Tax=Arctium lappa TaxID=4217 RepID=A0ACB8XUL6_ARCLA|nr:hypothetical protein L6452_38790 [Arctium lappa]
MTFDENKTRTSEHSSSELESKGKDKASTSSRVELDRAKKSEPYTDSDLDLLFFDAFNDLSVENNSQENLVNTNSHPTSVDISGPSEEVGEGSTRKTQEVSEQVDPENST